jgi:hypothetical protein
MLYERADADAREQFPLAGQVHLVPVRPRANPTGAAKQPIRPQRPTVWC